MGMGRPLGVDVELGGRAHDDGEQFLMSARRMIVLHYPPNEVPPDLVEALKVAKDATDSSVLRLKSLIQLMARKGFTVDEVGS